MYPHTAFIWDLRDGLGERHEHKVLSSIGVDADIMLLGGYREKFASLLGR